MRSNVNFYWPRGNAYSVYRPVARRCPRRSSTSCLRCWSACQRINCPIVVCGDFNMHVDQPEDVNAVRLEQLLQSFDCGQHVTEPTHDDGHTLDLVITRHDTDISDLRIGAMISGHSFIFFTLCVKKYSVNTQTVSSRAWRRLSLDAFTADLAT